MEKPTIDLNKILNEKLTIAENDFLSRVDPEFGSVEEFKKYLVDPGNKAYLESRAEVNRLMLESLTMIEELRSDNLHELDINDWFDIVLLEFFELGFRSGMLSEAVNTWVTNSAEKRLGGKLSVDKSPIRSKKKKWLEEIEEHFKSSPSYPFDKRGDRVKFCSEMAEKYPDLEIKSIENRFDKQKKLIYPSS